MQTNGGKNDLNIAINRKVIIKRAPLFYETQHNVGGLHTNRFPEEEFRMPGNKVVLFYW